MGPIAAWFDIIDVVSNRDGAGAWLNDMLGSNEDPGPCVSLRASSVGSFGFHGRILFRSAISCHSIKQRMIRVLPEPVAWVVL